MDKYKVVTSMVTIYTVEAENHQQAVQKVKAYIQNKPTKEYID